MIDGIVTKLNDKQPSNKSSPRAVVVDGSITEVKR